MKSTSKKRTPSIVNLTVKRRYLTQREVERLMDCARKYSRYGHRDATMMRVVAIVGELEPTGMAKHTKTFSTPSGTPKWRPTGSRTFGGTEPERPLHDAFVGLAGAGKLGTTSA